MSEMTTFDWDDAYSNAAYIPGADDFIVRWAQEAETFRKSWVEKDLDVVYGEGDRQRFDVFRPQRKSKGSSCSCTGATG